MRGPECQVLLDVSDDEEPVEKKDCLAKKDLEGELEWIAENDPDIIEIVLESCASKHLHW